MGVRWNRKRSSDPVSQRTFLNRNGLRCCDAQSEDVAPKMRYSRRIRWSRMGVFARSMEGLDSEGIEENIFMINIKAEQRHWFGASPKISEGAFHGFEPWGLVTRIRNRSGGSIPSRSGSNDKRRRLIGRSARGHEMIRRIGSQSRGGLNTRLHGVTDANRRPPRSPGRSATRSARRPCRAACRARTG